MMKRQKVEIGVSQFAQVGRTPNGEHGGGGRGSREGKPLNLGLGPDSDLPLVSLVTNMTPEHVLELFERGELGFAEISEDHM